MAPLSAHSDTAGASAFSHLLYEELLPEFFCDPSRNYPASAFRAGSRTVSDRDARDFARAWEAKLIEHQGRGLYRAPRSAASEQFFWHGPKAEGQRKLTLWLEPVITVAALARLHFDFGWPRGLLGTQSRDYAFDIVAFVGDAECEYIAGEVKKSVTEVNLLVDLMMEYGRCTDGTMSADGLTGKSLNAFRKVRALSARRAPVFWAVGPDGMNRVFAVRYDETGRTFLTETEMSLLRFPGLDVRG